MVESSWWVLASFWQQLELLCIVVRFGTVCIWTHKKVWQAATFHTHQLIKQAVRQRETLKGQTDTVSLQILGICSLNSRFFPASFLTSLVDVTKMWGRTQGKIERRKEMMIYDFGEMRHRFLWTVIWSNIYFWWWQLRWTSCQSRLRQFCGELVVWSSNTHNYTIIPVTTVSTACVFLFTLCVCLYKTVSLTSTHLLKMSVLYFNWAQTVCKCN